MEPPTLPPSRVPNSEPPQLPPSQTQTHHTSNGKSLDKSNGNPNACPGCGIEFNFKYELNKHTVTCQPAILIQEKEKLESQLEKERLKLEEEEKKKAGKDLNIYYHGKLSNSHMHVEIS